MAGGRGNGQEVRLAPIAGPGRWTGSHDAGSGAPAATPAPPRAAPFRVPRNRAPEHCRPARGRPPRMPVCRRPRPERAHRPQPAGVRADGGRLHPDDRPAHGWRWRAGRPGPAAASGSGPAAGLPPLPHRQRPSNRSAWSRPAIRLTAEGFCHAQHGDPDASRRACRASSRVSVPGGGGLPVLAGVAIGMCGQGGVVRFHPEPRGPDDRRQDGAFGGAARGR